MSRRTCTSCGAFLRSTNLEALCSPCDLTEQRVALEREARQMRERAERFRLYMAYCEGKQTMTAAILRVLPGTAAEVAERIGHDPRKTGRLLSKLVGQGIVERQGSGGNQHAHGVRYSVPADVEHLTKEAA